MPVLQGHTVGSVLARVITAHSGRQCPEGAKAQTSRRECCVAPAGLSPENVIITPALEDDFSTGQAVFKLRPETMEALFVLWRVTGDPRYQHWAWSLFESFQEHCRVSLLPAGSCCNVRLGLPGQTPDMTACWVTPKAELARPCRVIQMQAAPNC